MAHSSPDIERSRSGRRAPFFLAWLLAAAVASVALLAESHGHIDRTAYGDGPIYRYVASHLTTPPRSIDPVVSGRGSSLRYGRIGFPLLIWLGAAGHDGAIPYSQAVWIVIGAGFAGAATSAMFLSAGRMASLFPFIAPGFSLAVVGGYGEVLAVAFALWATMLAARRRFWWAALCVAGALLTRENAIFVLIGLLVWALAKPDGRGALVLLTSLLPVAGRYAFVDARFGHIPAFDPYLRATTDTIGTPFVALWRSLTTGPWGSVATASIHLLLAGLAFILFRATSIFRTVAAATAVQILGSGPGAWHYIGDGMRTSTFLELFTVIILLSYRWAPMTTAPPTPFATADTS